MTASDTYVQELLVAELARDEDRRHFLYTDTSGKLTIGIGHNIATNGLPDQIIDALLLFDIAIARDALDRNIPWWRTLNAPRQRVMLNMTFNMGWHGVSTFGHMLAAAKQQRYDDAANEMLASKWVHQVGERAVRLAAIMRTGEDPTEKPTAAPAPVAAA